MPPFCFRWTSFREKLSSFKTSILTMLRKICPGEEILTCPICNYSTPNSSNLRLRNRIREKKRRHLRHSANLLRQVLWIGCFLFLLLVPFPQNHLIIPGYLRPAVQLKMFRKKNCWTPVGRFRNHRNIPRHLPLHRELRSEHLCSGKFVNHDELVVG